MGHVRMTAHVDVAPEQVFEFGANAERTPEYHTSIIEVKDVSGPLDTVGAGYTAAMKIAGRVYEGRWEVTRVEKPRVVELKGILPGGGTATLIQRFAAAAGGTDCTVDMEYELPGGIIGGLANKLFVEGAIERDVRHSMENFKALLEAERPVDA
jgi:coenzyme Q-binding protein COQ10